MSHHRNHLPLRRWERTNITNIIRTPLSPGAHVDDGMTYLVEDQGYQFRIRVRVDRRANAG
jgi:hypothetical protein